VAPLPAVPGVIRVEFHFDVGTDAAAITRQYFEYSGGAPTDANCVAIATALYAGAVTNLIPVLNAANALTSVQVTDLSSAMGGQGFYSVNTAGSRSGAPLGAGTAFLVNMHIARRYRGGRPRNYWPVGSATDLDTPNSWGGSPAAALFAGIVDTLESLGSTVFGSTIVGSVCNVSYYEGFTAVTNPITGRTKDVSKLRTGSPVVDPLLSLAYSPRPASQRRRNLQRS
jgi:hypothetical protein